MAETATPMDDADEEQGDERETRQRSTIAFPYTDYEGAAEVAAAIHGNVGHGTCTSAQLAPWMGQSAKSSGFRTQVSAAKLFGLIENDGADNFRLTALGTRVVDPAQARVAKAEAFLKVPLFNALYERYKTSVTPPSAALEREIAGLGVSEKQKARARVAFENSATQTGFREHGPNRLVLPAVMVPPPKPQDDEKKKNNGGGGGGGGGGNVQLDLDPLLIALLQKIPSQGQDWPKDRRVRWFKTFAMNVSEVYDADGEPVELSITESATKGAPDATKLN